jgi:hypothetical protein
VSQVGLVRKEDEKKNTKLQPDCASDCVQDSKTLRNPNLSSQELMGISESRDIHSSVTVNLLGRPVRKEEEEKKTKLQPDGASDCV